MVGIWMKVDDIRLANFRNHARSNLSFGPGVNILFGKNGQGKTNVIEAISCLCLTKSFYAATDATLVKIGEDSFQVEGKFSGDSGMEFDLDLSYSTKQGSKSFTVNSERLERFSSAIGMFPVVILSPEQNRVTFGGPSDRRRFIDLVLSQLSRTYFENLLEYRQILKQKNRILAEAKQRGSLQPDILEPWNQGISKYGSRIIHKRNLFVEEFSEYVVRSYADLVDTNETPAIRYVGFRTAQMQGDVKSIEADLLEEIAAKQQEEFRRGLALVGPHRDDLAFLLNEIDLQKYASQGQHKTFLVALKVAEFFYLKEKKEETPILLLDDVLSELDETRSKNLLEHITGMGQTIVTTTTESPFGNILPWGDEHRKFYVQQGTCRPIGVGTINETAVGA
jgi:DNA replication and repair protein RecF